MIISLQQIFRPVDGRGRLCRRRAIDFAGQGQAFLSAFGLGFQRRDELVEGGSHARPAPPARCGIAQPTASRDCAFCGRAWGPPVAGEFDSGVVGAGELDIVFPLFYFGHTLSRRKGTGIDSI